MTNTTVAQRVAELQRAETDRVRAEKAQARKERLARLKAIATNELAVEREAARQARAREAVDAVRKAEPIVAVLIRGRVTVTVRLSDPEVTVRQTAAHAVGIVCNRLARWAEACEGAARARVFGSTVNAATAEEIAAFLSDEVRAAVKMGTVTIAVAPETKRRK